MARESATRITARDWRHLLTVGALVVGVLGTLVLGGRLQAEPSGEPHDLAANAVPVDEQAIPAPPGPATQPPPAAPTPAPPAAATKAPEPVVSAPPPRPKTKPAAATAPAGGGDWTLQFIVTCQTETADRLGRELDGDARLHLLPVRLDDRDCLRICWGAFPTRDAAVAGRGVPAALVAVNGEPIPRRISDLK